MNESRSGKRRTFHNHRGNLPSAWERPCVVRWFFSLTLMVEPLGIVQANLTVTLEDRGRAMEGRKRNLRQD
jgi:hypothetical protein